MLAWRHWPNLKPSSSWSTSWPMTYILCFINKGPMTLSLFAQQMQHQLGEILVFCQNTPPPFQIQIQIQIYLFTQVSKLTTWGAGTYINVSKGAKIRNRYNQVPHLTQDTNGKVPNSQQTPQREPRGQPFPSRWPQSTHKQTRTKTQQTQDRTKT